MLWNEDFNEEDSGAFASPALPSLSPGGASPALGAPSALAPAAPVPVPEIFPGDVLPEEQINGYRPPDRIQFHKGFPVPLYNDGRGGWTGAAGEPLPPDHPIFENWNGPPQTALPLWSDLQ